VRAAGHRGNRFTLGVNLFRAILDRPNGTLITRHQFEDTWSFLKHDDRRIHLEIPEMLAPLRALANEPISAHPLVLIAGERRSYNASLSVCKQGAGACTSLRPARLPARRRRLLCTWRRNKHP
jgi:hypothetical protein